MERIGHWLESVGVLFSVRSTTAATCYSGIVQFAVDLHEDLAQMTPTIEKGAE